MIVRIFINLQCLKASNSRTYTRKNRYTKQGNHGCLRVHACILTGVEHGSENGDSRADHGVPVHGLSEDDGSDDDDDDTLEGVEHGAGNGADLGGECEGELVVEVEAHTREDNVQDDVVGGEAALALGVLLAGSSGILEGVVPGLAEGGGLSDSNNTQSPDSGEDVHHGVHVGGIHVLGLVSLEPACTSIMRLTEWKSLQALFAMLWDMWGGRMETHTYIESWFPKRLIRVDKSAVSTVTLKLTV